MARLISDQKRDEANFDIHKCLEKILLSRGFSGCPRLQRFLSYLAEKTLGGESNNLKGYILGVEVFDRGQNFDPRVDSIVRVESARLRSKLNEYYSNEGANDPLRIDFPKGGFSLKFLSVDAMSPATAVSEQPLTRPVIPGTGSNRKKTSLAVLPFASHSSNPAHIHFANGITDSLICGLSNVPGLFLASRKSAIANANSELRADEIGLSLGVRYLLEGAVQHMDDRVRVSVHLSDTVTGGNIWTERYDRRVTNIFELQDEITSNVLRMLHIKLASPEEKSISSLGTSSAVAYNSLMLGLEQHWKYTPQSLEKAIHYFNQALEHDPDYAAAHAWLARSITFQWIMYWKNGKEVLDLAYRHALAAIQLNKYLPCAHTALGWVELWRKNAPESIASSRYGVFLDASNVDGFMFLSLSLSATGIGAEALKYIEMSIRLSPNPSAFHYLVLGMAHYVTRNYNDAISALECGAKMNEFFIPVHYHLCWLYKLQKRESEWRRKRDQLAVMTKGNLETVRSPWVNPELNARHIELVQQAGLVNSPDSSGSPHNKLQRTV